MAAKVDCIYCKTANIMTSANTTLYAFTRQPALSYYHVHCVKCGQEWENFVAPTEWELQLRAIIDSKVSVIEEEWVDDKTFEQYRQCFGTGEVEISPHEEKEILFWRWLLNHYDIGGFDDRSNR